MINPGTVAAIAATLMSRGEALDGNAEIFGRFYEHHRPITIKRYVTLAWEIALETEAQATQVYEDPKE